MRVWQLLCSTFLLGACARTVVTRDARVAVRERRGPDDAALVVVYRSDLCKLTIRDRSGQLHDRALRDGASRPIAMTREVPNGIWRIQNSGHRSTLLTALAMPPGHYEVVRYATSNDWEQLDVDSGPALGQTDCDDVEWHSRRLPFRIEAGQVTLMDVPAGPVGFDELNAMLPAPDDPLVRDAIATWFPLIEQARKNRKAELASRRRQPRHGYDVYPDCDGKVAVVRAQGTPFAWYSDPNDDSKRQEFRHGVPIAIPSVHATGFGAGCVRGLAFVLFLSDSTAVDAAVSAIGQWLARENLAGEIDLVVSGVPTNL